MFGGQDGLRRIMSQDTIKPNNLGETLRRFAGYFKPFWLVLLLVAFLIVLATWTQVTVPVLIGQAVDCYITPAASQVFGSTSGASASSSSGSTCWLSENGSPQGMTQAMMRSALGFIGFPPPSITNTTAERMAGLAGVILLIVILFVLGSILTGLTFYWMTWAGARVLRTMRQDVFRQLHRLSLSYYAEHEAGDLMSRITNDSETIQQAFSFALVNVLSGLLLLFGIAFNMIRLNPPLALVSLAVVPIMAVATLWFSGQARRAFRRTRQEMGSVNAELQESIAAVREVQAFNRADENIENFRAVNAANRDANIRAVAFTSALAPSLEALGYLALAIVAAVGGFALLGDQSLMGTTISLGLVITFLTYVQRFNQPIQQIAVLWTNLQSAVAGGERIFNLLDVEPAILDMPGAREMPSIQGAVEFQNVSAAYKVGVPVLDRVSFTAQPGQTIAIVGPTGAGKTTIINLIPRFYDVTGGTVMIDGLDVRYVTSESLRRQIGIVLQDTFLFSTTVMENIRFGRLDASDEEVIAAAKLAYADAFIDRLADGYQTVLGERGSGLSQ